MQQHDGVALSHLHHSLSRLRLTQAPHVADKLLIYPLRSTCWGVIGNECLAAIRRWPVLAGVWFRAMAHQLYPRVRRGEPVKPLRLFLESNNYLAVVFCAPAIDSALTLPTLLGA